MDKPIQDKIAARLARQGRGKVFTPKDFLDLGSRDAVDQGLSRLVKADLLKRFGRGLYYYPNINARLGITVPPDVDDVADAIARQTGSRIAPSGAMAANRLGLSTQVPAKPTYLTDGRSRQVRAGNFLVVMKHVSPKELPVGNRMSATVLQALRHIGQDAVNPSVLKRIRQALPPKQRAQLLRDARYTTDWIADAVRKIAGQETESATHG